MLIGIFVHIFIENLNLFFKSRSFIQAPVQLYKNKEEKQIFF